MTKLLSLDRLVPSVSNPRTEFDAEKMEELCDSIRQRMARGLPGIHTPLRAKPLTGGAAGIEPKDCGKFELIAGHRRLKAAELVGLGEVPVIVESIAQKDLLMDQVTDNLHRDDLKLWELGRVFDEEIAAGRHTVESLAELMSKKVDFVYDARKAAKVKGPLKEAMEAEKIGPNAALKLDAAFRRHDLSEAEQTKAISDNEGKSVREVTSYTQVLAARATKKVSTEERKPAPAAPKGPSQEEEVYFVIRRDASATFLTYAGGWAKTPAAAMRYASADQAFAIGWAKAAGHSVLKMFPSGEYERQIPPSQRPTLIGRNADLARSLEAPETKPKTVQAKPPLSKPAVNPIQDLVHLRLEFNRLRHALNETKKRVPAMQMLDKAITKVERALKLNEEAKARTSRKTKLLSAADRARIAAAQRARWARAKAGFSTKADRTVPIVKPAKPTAPTKPAKKDTRNGNHAKPVDLAKEHRAAENAKVKAWRSKADIQLGEQAGLRGTWGQTAGARP